MTPNIWWCTGFEECCNFIHEQREESRALPWAPGVLNILCCPGGSTALPKCRMFCAGCFGFATVLFQLINLPLLQVATGSQEARGAFLQEWNSLYEMNLFLSGAFGKLSSAEYFVIWWLWHWAENGVLSLNDVSQVSRDLNVHFLITVLSIPFKWDSLENSCHSTFT